MLFENRNDLDCDQQPEDSIAALPAAVVRRIRERLGSLEVGYRVRVLHAIESGSRGWGFASPDSDYDGRCLYVHAPDWYFSVFEQRDVIEAPIEDEDGVVFDVNGWDLRQALRLLARSNPVLIEWLQSSIVYQGMPGFARAMPALAEKFYSPKAAYYHYFHRARKNFREHLLGDSIRLKKYFYVVRPVLACMWIEKGLGIPSHDAHGPARRRPAERSGLRRDPAASRTQDARAGIRGRVPC